MSKIKFKLNQRAVGDLLLKGEGTKAVLKKHAEKIKNSAEAEYPGGYNVKVSTGSKRAQARVEGTTEGAYWQEVNHKTLNSKIGK